MSKINNLDFAALNLSGDNYLQWALDAKIILKSKGLGECITENNNANEKDRYRAILIIRHHLAESLKDQYLTIENPLDLWNELKSRYDHQRTVILPKARFDWTNLRIQDYKSMDEYNSALFKILSKMKLCGESLRMRICLRKHFPLSTQAMWCYNNSTVRKVLRPMLILLLVSCSLSRTMNY